MQFKHCNKVVQTQSQEGKKFAKNTRLN